MIQIKEQVQDINFTMSDDSKFLLVSPKWAIVFKKLNIKTVDEALTYFIAYPSSIASTKGIDIESVRKFYVEFWDAIEGQIYSKKKVSSESELDPPPPFEEFNLNAGF